MGFAPGRDLEVWKHSSGPPCELAVYLTSPHRPLQADPIGPREIAMRSITWIRNYSLLVFFVVLVGGVLLQPGNRESKPNASAMPVVTAGFAP